MSDAQVTAVVDRLVQAYNAGDMEAFLGCFSDEPKLYRFPNTLTLDGREAIRAEYEVQFANGCRNGPSGRIVVGRHVAERAHVTFGEGASMEFMTIYTVEDDRISRVDFLFAEAAAEQ
jgi:uncharacterized protein (TIGR02246 family)